MYALVRFSFGWYFTISW